MTLDGNIFEAIFNKDNGNKIMPSIDKYLNFDYSKLFVNIYKIGTRVPRQNTGSKISSVIKNVFVV